MLTSGGHLLGGDGEPQKATVMMIGNRGGEGERGSEFVNTSQCV